MAGITSVTRFISQLKQPKGGYLPIKCFDKQVFESKYTLYEKENISPIIVGIAVDLLIRVLLLGREHQLSLQHRGAKAVGDEEYFFELEHWLIRDLNDQCIKAACQLAGYDVIYRAGPEHYRDVRGIQPDKETTHNVREMVSRGILFFETKTILEAGSALNSGIEGNTIIGGDIDILTTEGIWDIKTTKGALTNKHTLQIYMYTLFAQRAANQTHCHNPLFKNCDFTYSGIFNPRKNESRFIKNASIDPAITQQILLAINE